MKYKEEDSVEEHMSVSSTRRKKKEHMSVSKCCELNIKLHEL
jgi:hypothetical protein